MMQRSNFQNLLFITILVVIAFLFNQPKYLDHPPRSAHQWRQSDAYSITLNYYNEGMDFFKPSIHLQQSDGGKAVGEFPIIYYFDALIWKITGPSFLVIRLVNLLIAFCGLFALFKLIEAITKDRFFSFAIPILLYSSPVFGYYSSSFLVNIDALSFLFIAWWFFYRFENSGKWIHLFVALLFITLSGLLRTTMLIGFVPIVIWFVYRWSNCDQNKSQIVLRSVILILPLILISSWILYAAGYNAKYHSTYFLTTIRPVWEAYNPAKIWSKFNYEALSNLYPAFLRIIFLLMILGLILRIFKSRWIWFSLIVFAELVVYSLLWYQNLDFHDYYLIEYLILVPLVSIAVLLYLKEKWNEIFLSWKFRAIVSVSLVFLLFYGAARTRIKYDKKAFFFTHMFLTENEIKDWGNFHWYYDRSIKPYETIDPYLDSIGIKHTDLVVSLPDPSSNITLSLMDRKGFSMMYMDRREVRDSLPSFIDQGAKYLMIYDHRDVESGYFKEFTQQKIGTYQNVQIFKLK